MYDINSLYTNKRKLLVFVEWVVMMTPFIGTFGSISSAFDVVLLLLNQCLRQMSLILSKDMAVCIHSLTKRDAPTHAEY